MVLDVASESILTFTVDGFDGELRVLQLSGREAMSELFHFGVDLACQDSEIDLDGIVGQAAQLQIHYLDGARELNGIISRFEQGHVGETFTAYYAELVPSVWLLTQRYDSRIFQEQSVPDIIQAVLKNSGATSRFALKGSHAPREYCVQYRETDWNFIMRLMEEVGIFCQWEHRDGKDILVIADAPGVHVPIDGTPDVLFREPTGLVEAEEFIYQFRSAQQIRPGKITHTDYNFKTPALDMFKDQSARRNPELEVYDYPGLYPDQGTGGTLARARLEALQSPRLSAVGESTCRRMIPGFKFTMQEHRRESFNQEYLLTSVRHTASQPLGQDETGGRFHYSNSFVAIPASVPYRPPRVTPKPVVEGTQTAVVTGPAGEEIYTDEYGRIKVQFHWDREGKKDDKSSCWIRVAHPWAGPSWGSMFIPRVGFEVAVQFLEGDPDRPLVIGSVYNAQNMPPYPLDAQKNKSTIKSNSTKGGGGSNELRFDDTKGSEEVYQHAQKDLTIRTENDKNQSTGHDETLKIGNDRSKDVGNNETTKIGKDRTEEVGANETIKIGTDRTEEVGANEKIKIGADRTEEVAANETIKIGADRTEDVAGNETIKIGGNESITVGGSMTLSVGSGGTIKVAKDVSTSVGADSSTSVGKAMSTDVGKTYDLSAGDSMTISSNKDITLSCGKATINMKKDGTITINGKDVTMQGSGKITVKASKDVIVKGKKILEN